MATTQTVTDNLGNTWDGPLLTVTDRYNYTYTIWSALVTTAGSCTVTITQSVNAATWNCWYSALQEYSGLSGEATGYTDGLAGNVGFTDNMFSGAASPTATADGELVAGFVGTNQGTRKVTAPTGWTVLNNDPQGAGLVEMPGGLTVDLASTTAVGDEVTATKDVLDPVVTWGAVLAVFKLAAGSSAPWEGYARSSPRS